MRLHQLKVEYDAEQDRLLMLVAASEGVELKLALTRRFVKLLWPLLVKLAEEASPRIRTQANPDARKALLGLEHEHAVSKADFSKPYDAADCKPRASAVAAGGIQPDTTARAPLWRASRRRTGRDAFIRFGVAALVARLLQAAVRIATGTCSLSCRAPARRGPAHGSPATKCL